MNRREGRRRGGNTEKKVARSLWRDVHLILEGQTSHSASISPM